MQYIAVFVKAFIYKNLETIKDLYSRGDDS